MDPDYARRIIAFERLLEQNGDSLVNGPMTPLGYSPMIARLDGILDALQEMHATLSVVTQQNARKKSISRPKVKHQPRPVTAIDEARKAAERDELKQVAAIWFQNADGS